MNHRRELIGVRAGSAPMSLHFSDASPVAECHVRTGQPSGMTLCQWHGHGDSINDAVLAWTKHLTEQHREDWG
jgi:hypothetical protein